MTRPQVFIVYSPDAKPAFIVDSCWSTLEAARARMRQMYNKYGFEPEFRIADNVVYEPEDLELVFHDTDQ